MLKEQKVANSNFYLSFAGKCLLKPYFAIIGIFGKSPSLGSIANELWDMAKQMDMTPELIVLFRRVLARDMMDASRLGGAGLISFEEFRHTLLDMYRKG